jgi:ribosome-binding factor A
MQGNRIERVQVEVRREISAILQQRAGDPRLTWVSVVRVEISSDLTHAKVFVSSLGDPDARAGALRALQKAGPFIRSELSRRIQLRRIPELSFREDRGLEASLRINQLLAESKPAVDDSSTASPSGSADSSSASRRSDSASSSSASGESDSVDSSSAFFDLPGASDDEETDEDEDLR